MNAEMALTLIRHTGKWRSLALEVGDPAIQGSARTYLTPARRRRLPNTRTGGVRQLCP